MVKGTDLIIGIQVLIVQHKNCQGLYVEVNADEQLNRDSALCDFLKNQQKTSSDFKRELQKLLSSLGNACDYCNMDNLHNFIQEKHMPALNLERFPSKVFRSLKEQYLSLIESYKTILSFKAIPITAESTMLRHLTELQGIAGFLIKHKIFTRDAYLPSYAGELNRAG
ncbi:MAG TPA: hypothetical protein ENH91_09675 [Leeuwenhoekiella sp.]|nr:hypothetical protein [Leeuwenhoekiella sp.]